MVIGKGFVPVLLINPINSPMERAIICFSGLGVIFILSTMDRMGLKVVLAVTEAGMCHLLLFAVDMSLLTRRNCEGNQRLHLSENNVLIRFLFSNDEHTNLIFIVH